MKIVMVTAMGLLAPIAAHAASVIDNGVIQLGVDEEGQLNILGELSDYGTPYVGLRYIAGEVSLESTANGCLCEGWGVGNGGTGAFGAANNDDGVQFLMPVSFTFTASTAKSVVDVTGGNMRVTHDFKPATETDNLYRVTVTIENTGSEAISDLRYTRTMDWDVDPTAFSEFVTIKGTGTTTLLRYSDDNGFSDANPFASRSAILAGTIDTDFIDSGPADHGAHFDFGFGALEAGKSYTFDIFYGAGANEREALAALGAVGAELYSLGQSNCGGVPNVPCNNGVTFIFGFSGVGGKPVEPPPNPNPIPVPASAVLLLGALGMLGARKAVRRP